MTRSAIRQLSAVLFVGALLTGCGSSDSPDEPTPAAAPPSTADTARAEVCDAYGSLKVDVGDLGSEPLDSSASAEELQQSAQELQSKAATLRDDLATIQRRSDGGPADAVIGVFNQKADALSASLTEAKTGAQEELGPTITAAQQELGAAYASLTTAMDKVCPSN